jgi:hypothetical protein
VRFDQRASHVDLTGIPQRWLRGLVWDYLAAMLQSPRCPRSGGVIDGIRRAAIELGAFLEIDAPGGGHDPTGLDGEHMRRFVADQRRRERDGLPSLAIKQPGGNRRLGSAADRVCQPHCQHIPFMTIPRLPDVDAPNSGVSR